MPAFTVYFGKLVHSAPCQQIRVNASLALANSRHQPEASFVICRLRVRPYWAGNIACVSSAITGPRQAGSCGARIVMSLFKAVRCFGDSMLNSRAAA
jgi:hypothetical protein